MHGRVPLGGPIWWFSVALFVLTWLLCGFVALDALTPRRQARFAELPESRWIYIVPAGLFFVVSIVVQFANIQALAAGVIIITPILIVLGITYLLRVIFIQ